MKKFIFALLTFSVLLFVGCNPPNTTTRTEGFNFLYYWYTPYCALDVYRNDDTVKPAVLMIHGSAWMNVLDRFSITQQERNLFLNNGYHVVNIDYRKIKWNNDNTNDVQPTYKDMLDDVKSAIKYIKDNAEKFTIDTSKIILYGYSSGAHLAELYSYSITDSPIPVRLCIAKAGPSDFSNPKFRECDPFGFTSDEKLRTSFIRLIKRFALKVYKNEDESSDAYNNRLDAIPDSTIADPFRVSLVKALLGIESDVTDDIDAIADSSDDEIQHKINDASPLYHVKNKTIQTGDLYTPPYTILLHGEKDTLVDCSMSKDLHEELGGSSKLFLMPNAGHDLKYSDQSADDAAAYKNFEDCIVDRLNTIKAEPIHLTATHY